MDGSQLGGIKNRGKKLTCFMVYHRTQCRCCYRALLDDFNIHFKHVGNFSDPAVAQEKFSPGKSSDYKMFPFFLLQISGVCFLFFTSICCEHYQEKMKNMWKKHKTQIRKAQKVRLARSLTCCLSLFLEDTCQKKSLAKSKS